MLFFLDFKIFIMFYLVSGCYAFWNFTVVVFNVQKYFVFLIYGKWIHLYLLACFSNLHGFIQFLNS